MISFALDTIDLTCFTDEDCLHYAGKSIIATCNSRKCLCQQKQFNQKLACQPTNLKQSNKVGTFCGLENPCNTIYNAFCNTTTSTCECNKDYVASADKMKCLKST